MAKTVSDRVPLILVLLILAGVPAALWAYGRVYIPYKHRGARVVTLTAVADDGVWTQEPVIGFNYWRKSFSATPEIEIDAGETLVLRLASADVLHSFAIPALEIGPIDVPAGEVREVRVTTDKPGKLLFLCWQMCSHLHQKLRGAIVVRARPGGPAAPAAEVEPDL